MMEIRPRTAGEILDDAGRLVLADAPLLLALSGLFTVPPAAAFLLLLTLPAPEGLARLFLPAVTALFLPLTGLGSGACQALCRRRAEGMPVTLVGCLIETWRRGVGHATARAMVWALTLLGTLIVVVPAAFLLRGLLLANRFDPLTGLVIRLLLVAFALAVLQGLAACAGGIAVHPLLAGGDHRCFAAWAASVREAQRQAGKVAAIALTRPFLWMVAVINLYILVRAGLWAGDALAGLDLALPSLVLTSSNSAYVAALGLLVWLLLVPYFEASNYLLHADARARHEGLDLWYRVRRLFPAGGKGLTAAIALLLLTATPAFAADSRLDAVRAARKEIGQLARKIEVARPFDGKDWLPPLRAIAERLDADGANRPGRYRWFGQALQGFEQKKRAAALQVLAGFDRRLALIEQELAQPEEVAGKTSNRSKDDIRAVLPADSAEPSRPATHPREKIRKTDTADRQQRDDPNRREGPSDGGRPERTRQGPSAVGPAPAAGSNNFLRWMAPAGVMAFVVVLAVLLARRRLTPAKPPAAAPTDPETLSLEALMRQGGDGLWRQADDLAQTGKSLEAVRSLYLAVLALLHRADLIRYAPTRTNGEYVRQLRPREEVCGPFRGLTGLFEIKWYGERSCEPADYDRCRRLAEEVRQRATK